MWLMDYITKNSLKDAQAQKGDITQSSANSVCVNSALEHRDVSVVAPYGISYNPPVGEKSVVVPIGGRYACVGVIAECDEALDEGELMLCSKGGASIVLKNDGSVIINGKVF